MLKEISLPSINHCNKKRCFYAISCADKGCLWLLIVRYLVNFFLLFSLFLIQKDDKKIRLYHNFMPLNKNFYFLSFRHNFLLVLSIFLSYDDNELLWERCCKFCDECKSFFVWIYVYDKSFAIILTASWCGKKFYYGLVKFLMSADKKGDEEIIEWWKIK